MTCADASSDVFGRIMCRTLRAPSSRGSVTSHPHGQRQAFRAPLSRSLSLRIAHRLYVPTLILAGMQLQQIRLVSSSRVVSSRSFPTARIQHRARPRAFRVAAAQWVDVHEGKKLLEMSNFLVVDVRTFKEYDREHIVKPAKACVSVPFNGKDAFLSDADKKVGSGRSRGLLVLSATGGDDACAAADYLESEGYETVRAVEGGYGAFTGSARTDPSLASPVNHRWRHLPPNTSIPSRGVADTSCTCPPHPHRRALEGVLHAQRPQHAAQGEPMGSIRDRSAQVWVERRGRC